MTRTLLILTLLAGCSATASQPTSSPTTARSAEGYINAGEWRARIEQDVLRVDGVVKVAATNYGAELKFDSIRKSNPPELILNIVIAKTGEIGGMMITDRPVRYEDRQNLNAGRVHIVYPNGEMHTIEPVEK